MGLFDFFKDAGDDISAPVEVSQERMDELRQENITRKMAQLGAEAGQVAVAVQGDTATLTGRAPNQEAMEKLVLCAGNQHGIAQVDCQIQVDEPPPPAPGAGAAEPEPVAVAAKAAGEAAEQTGAPAESTFYTVKSGDTLGKIAAEHYGAANKYMVIFEANKPMLADPDKIYPGQTLRIPPL
jgi:nucleoid-associated protein YgaU